MILKIPLSRNLNVDPSKRNVSLSVHDRNFLRDRVSSTCEPGLRHTGGWLALLGSSRLPARSHSNFSIGVTSRRSYTSAYAHDATKFSCASLLHYVVAYNRRMHHQLRCPSTCATVCNHGNASKPMLLRSFRFSLVFEACRERAPFIGPVKVIQVVSMILFIF